MIISRQEILALPRFSGMVKKGFTLIEILVVLTLSIVLVFAAFDLGSHFIRYFRKLHYNASQTCLAYTALQMVRADLEAAPAELNKYQQISNHVLSFYLPDHSRLKWKFKEKQKRLYRVHYYTNKKGITSDSALVLESVENFQFIIDKNGEVVQKISTNLTHNGIFFQPIIYLRNGTI